MKSQDPNDRRAASEWTDEQLLEQLLLKQNAARLELTRRYKGLILSCIDSVFRPFGKMLGNADRDDVYGQMLNLLFVRDMHRLRVFSATRGMRLSSWIAMIARHAAIDHLRSLRRYRALLPHYNPLELQETAVDPEESLRRDERRTQVLLAMGTLSPRDRSFLDMFLDDHRDAKDIALALDISIKTVYTKKHKLQHRLTQHVSRETSARC